MQICYILCRGQPKGPRLQHHVRALRPHDIDVLLPQQTHDD